MARRHPDRPSALTRLLELLHLRRRPPDIGVREPRRPVPSAPGGSVALERPDDDRP